MPPLLRAGLFCGLVAPLLWAGVIFLAGEMRPGFGHFGQYISELAERGSSTQPLMRYGGFVATGLMHLGFAAALAAILPRDTDRPRLGRLVAALVVLNGLGRIGAGLFACEPGCAAPEVLDQRLHHLAASLAFFALIGATLLAAPLFRGSPALRPLGAYSAASGLAGIVFLGLMSSSEATHGYVGLYERLASGVLSLWIFITAAWLVTRPAPAGAATTRG